MGIYFRGWSIIEEFLSTNNFVDLNSIIEEFSNLRPRRFTSDSKYVEIMFSLCKKEKLSILRPLLQELEDKNLQDENKFTLLHCAAQHGNIEIVKYLFPLVNDKLPISGPRTYSNGFTVDKETPLHLAARKGHLSVIDFMVHQLKNGDMNPALGDGRTVLHRAAYYGHLNVVSFYTSRLDNPNPGKVSNDDFRGRTPLHFAAQQGHLEVVKHFCNLLQDKNPCDDYGYTVLHSAASKGHIDIVKYLVQFVDNKHPEAGDYWNYRTPLNLAKDNGKTKVVDFLKNQ